MSIAAFIMNDNRSSQRSRHNDAPDLTSSYQRRLSCGDQNFFLRSADQGVVSVDGDIRQYESSCSDDNSVCSDSSYDQDVPEILELRNALEYLVTVRDIKNIYNSDHKNWQTTGNHSMSEPNNAPANNEEGRNSSDHLLHSIPNLVNRILIEHYSTTHLNSAQADRSHHHVKYLTRKQKEKMNRLLLAVIVEFSEPYFAKVVRRRQHTHKQQLLLQQKNNNGGKTMRPRKNQESPLSLQFDERAVSWATKCIDQLIRPPTASYCPPIRNDNVKSSNKRQYTHCVGDNNYHIPELDALLATSSPHDGLEAEERMQHALMHSLKCRRLSQSIGMMGTMGGTKDCDGEFSHP